MSIWNSSRPRKIMSCLTTVGCLSLAIGSSQIAMAQKPTKPDAAGKPGQNVGNGAANNRTTMEIAKSEGKLEAIQGNTIKIADASSNELFLVVSRNTDFKYSGEADTKWLTPGLMVRFTTTFEQGKPSGALKQLEVFTPSMDNGMSMEKMRDQTPGVYQEGKPAPEGAKGLFAEEKKSLKNPEKKTPTKKDKEKEKEPEAGAGPQTMRVVGKLLGVQGNAMNVIAHQPLQFELDPEAKISVVSTDMAAAMNIVTKGDGVTVSGLRDPSQPAYLYAERLEVKAGQKLTSTKPQPRGRTTGRGKDAPDAKGKPDPKETKGKLK